MASLFTRIIEGELPGHFALRDDQCVVFMTISPITTGHALVVPRAPIDQWIDMPAALNGHLFDVARQVGLAQRVAFGTDRVGLLIAGFEVNHCQCIACPQMRLLTWIFLAKNKAYQPNVWLMRPPD